MLTIKSKNVKPTAHTTYGIKYILKSTYDSALKASHFTVAKR